MKIDNSIKQALPEPINKELKEASRLFEQQFLNEMVKAMRATVDHSELTKPSFAENVYQGHLDQEYVEVWSKVGGIGLADLIYANIAARMNPSVPLSE